MWYDVRGNSFFLPLAPKVGHVVDNGLLSMCSSPFLPILHLFCTSHLLLISPFPLDKVRGDADFAFPSSWMLVRWPLPRCSSSLLDLPGPINDHSHRCLSLPIPLSIPIHLEVIEFRLTKFSRICHWRSDSHGQITIETFRSVRLGSCWKMAGYQRWFRGQKVCRSVKMRFLNDFVVISWPFHEFSGSFWSRLSIVSHIE